MCQAGHWLLGALTAKAGDPVRLFRATGWVKWTYTQGRTNPQCSITCLLSVFRKLYQEGTPPEPPTIKPIMDRWTSAMKFGPFSLKVRVNFRSKYQRTELWFHISDTISFQPPHTVAEKYFPFFVNCFDYEHHVTSRDIWWQWKISQQGYR